jgi:hypothetical protein
MDYKGVIVGVLVVLLGLAVCVIVTQADPASQDLRLEAARKQAQRQETIMAAQASASPEIASAKETVAPPSPPVPQVLQQRELKGPGFFEGKGNYQIAHTGSAGENVIESPPTQVSPPAPEVIAPAAPVNENVNGSAPTTIEPVAPVAPIVAPPVTPMPTSAPQPVVPQGPCAYCRSLRTIQCMACATSGGLSTGLMICAKCKLSRTVVCPRCHGRWDRPCSSCGGSGAYYRTIRNLAGQYVRVRGGDCSTCRGAGTIVLCHNCTKGRIPCTACEGIGRVGTCPKCSGEKRIPCPKCQTGVK